MTCALCKKPLRDDGSIYNANISIANSDMSGFIQIQFCSEKCGTEYMKRFPQRIQGILLTGWRKGFGAA